jgi:hypothetical protein
MHYVPARPGPAAGAFEQRADFSASFHGEVPMTNLWLKKNPFMSLWLSSANRVAGAARGQVAAEVKRQTASESQKATTDLVKFWTGSATTAVAPAAVKRKKRRR